MRWSGRLPRPPMSALRFILRVVPVLLLGLTGTSRVHAGNLILNGSFDSGIDGWHQEGTVYPTGGNALLSDQGGMRVVLFQTVAVPADSIVSLQLSFDFFNALSPSVALGRTPDSIFGTVFTGVQPFGSLYGSGTYTQATALLDADYRGSVNFPEGMTLGASPKGAGWTRHTVPIPVVPFVTVGFEFVEGNDTPGDSTAAFDNIALIAQPIPEPGVAAVLALAAGLFAIRRRRAAVREPVCLSVLAGILCLIAGASGGRAEEPPPLDPSLVRTTAKAERSVLDRTTGVLTSTVDLEAVNAGTRRIDGPVHALIRFRDTATGAEMGRAVTVADALGGIDRPPHQVPYFDLSAQAAGGWEPAEAVSFVLVFSRARTLNVTYEVTLTGRVNSPPTVDPGGPYTGKVGEVIPFAASASDPDGDPLVFAWDFGDGTTADTASAQHIYATAGLKSVRVSVDDGRGGVTERDVTAIVRPEGDFALAHTRVVDGVGHPVPDAVIEETGPDGTRALEATRSGFASLGTRAGEYVWKFSAPGHQPVWRAATLAGDDVRLVPSPWLAPDGPATPVSVLETTVLGTGSGPGSTRIEFPAGSFTQPGRARLTALGPQSLPFPLPTGWSPLGAFALELPESPAAPGTTRLELTDRLATDEFLSLVRYEPDTRSWRIIETAAAPDPAHPDRTTLALTTPGAYAAVVRDQGTGAPLPATAGETLPAGSAQELSTRVAAVGVVDPAQKPASLDPEAVTTRAQAVFTPATGVLPSGSWFRIAVQETYDLADGTALRTPDSDATVFAYRRPAHPLTPAPGSGEGHPTAVFPLRPQLLFGPADLNEARLRVEVLPPLGDGAAALSAQGGALGSGDIRLTVPPNALSGFTAGSLRSLDPAGFRTLAGPGQSIIRAFDLNLGRLVDGAALQLSLATPLAPDTHFALARLVRFPGGSGLAPVQRFRTDAAGRLETTEPASPPRLPGLTGTGQYLLVQLDAPQGLVTGQVAHTDTTPAPGTGVRVARQAWLSITDTAARFQLLAPAGNGTALASHPTNGDGAEDGFTMSESLEPVTVTLTLGNLPPRVLATTPPDGAARTNPVSPIIIEFSEKLAPASLGATPVAVRPDGAGGDVPGGATLDLSGRFLTFLPTAPLAPGVRHTLTISADLRDRQNLALVGPQSFTFTTAPPAARGEGAQLTLYEPGATKVPDTILAQLVGYRAGADSSHVVAHGSPGTADADVPVILVNESTNATATVLSKPDGSFASFIDADEADFVSAVFVNANGTRVTVPATKQRFDDGRTGLYRQGGILEAASAGEPAEIIVEPGAVPTRTIFTLEEVGLSEVRELLKDVEPESGGKVLGGLRYAEQGDPLTLAADVVFPLKPGDIPDDVDPAKATFSLTMPMQIDGVTAFQIIDAMSFEPVGPSGRLVTRSPPFIGLLLRQINAIRKEAVFTDTFNRVASAGSGSAATQINSIGAFLIPILVAPAAGQKIAGKIITLRSGEPFLENNGDPLRGAFVRVETGLAAASTATPGLFRRGETFAMSEADGRFAFHLATSFGRRLVATHPRFPFQRAASAGIATGELVARTTLIFRQPPPVQANIEDTAAPIISVAQSPVVASSGRGESDGTVLTVTAIDDLDVASLSIERDAFLSTTTGEVIDINRLVAPTLLEERVPSPSRRQHRFRVQAAEKGTAIYRLRATDSAGNPTTREHIVIFGDPVAGGGVAAARRLSNAWPPNGATGQALGTPIRLRFSQPLDPADIADPGWITLGPPGECTLAAAEASPDRRELTLRYFVKNTSATTLTLTFDTTRVNQAPTSANGPVAVNYRIGFAPAPALNVTGGTLNSGAGTVMMGRYLYSLDRTSQNPDNPQGGEIRVHEIMPNGTLQPRQTELIPERPTDIVAIPAYPLREFDGTVLPAEPYLAVFSGGANDIKRLGLYRIQPDGRLIRALNARPPVSLGISQVVKAKWDPPFLAFQELTSETTSVSLVNLNALYIGFRLSQSQPGVLRTLPQNGRPGVDANNDGDFADEGEIAPLPASRDGQVFGLEFSWAPANPAERLRDFDFSADLGLLGGVFSGPGGNGLVMVLGGGGQLDEATARVRFPEDPKRLTFLPGLPLRVDGQEKLTDVALVSTVAFGDTRPALLVADVTNPAAPVLIGRALLPAGSGSLNTVILRDDGRLAVSTTSGGILVLDPRLLLQTNPDGLTAALVKQIPGLAGGGERAFTADASGLSATAGGTAVRTALDAPLIEVVTFDLTPFDQTQWKSGSVFAEPGLAAASTEDKMTSVLDRAQRIGSGLIFPAGDSGGDIAAESRRHYYVTVRAPGSIGPTLDLAATAVDSAGRPTLPTNLLAAPTFLGHEDITARFIALGAFNALKALDLTSDSTAFIENLIDLGIETAFDRLVRGDLFGTGAFTKPAYATDLKAHRVSDHPTHPLYNTYLAGPIVLLSEDLTIERHTTLATQIDRRYLAASAGFWVGLSPTLDPASLAFTFASRQDEALQFELTAGMNLRTLFRLAGIAVDALTGNTLSIVQRATGFVDAELVRSLQPGVNDYVHVGRQRNPLVFIPGIMGSELRINGDGKKLWVDLTDAGPSLLTTSAAKLTLGPDGQPRPPGETADASQIVRSVAGKDMAGSMVDFLVGAMDYRPLEFDFFNGLDNGGLEPDSETIGKQPTLFPFPYDWRRDNTESAAKLARYIELIRSLHPEAENVDILAHSMGGLLSRRYMLDHPGVVGKLVLIASPLLGATKAVYTKREGDLDDFYINLLVGRSTGKQITRYMPGLDQLMPSQALFDLGFRPVWEHGIDLDGDGFAFGPLTYTDYRSFLDGSLYPADPAPRPSPIRLNNEPFHSFTGTSGAQDDWTGDSSGTQLFHLIGVQTVPNTITRLRVRPRLKEVPAEESRDVSLSLPPVTFTDTDAIIGGQPRLPEDGDAAFPVSPEAYRLGFDLELVRGAGDGTVPLLSAARGFEAGPGFDLNPSRMRVIPVVGASTDHADNERVGHVPVLVNAITKRWVSEILSERFQDKDVPQLLVTGSFTLAEGATTTLTAQIAQRPDGVQGEPEFTWDLGDGRMLRGRQATFGFPDDGDYVVTCVARFPGGEALTGTGGVAGLTSRVLRVTNQPPAPEITITPETPVRGQPVRLRVNPRDPSPTDSFSYAWTTGDTSAGGLEITTTIPLLQHNFALPGTYTVTVRVRDDDGAEATATRTIQVSEPPVTPNPLPRLANAVAPNNFLDDLNPFDDDPAGSLEYARVFVTGVHTEEELVRVDHDLRRVIGNVDGSVVRDDAGRADTSADGSVQIDLYRDVVAGELPARSRVTVRALGASVRFRVEYFSGAGPSRCFFHQCTTDVGDDVGLELEWATLLSLPEDAVRSMTHPTATTAGTIPGCQRSELAAETSFDDATAEVSLDMTLIDQDPVDDIATDPTPTFIDDGPPALQPGGSLDPCRDLDQRLFRKLTGRTAHAATAPGGARYVAGQSPGSEFVVRSGTPPSGPPAPLSEEEADDVRSAVKLVFTTASAVTVDDPENRAGSLFRRFMLSLDDIRILEQGTGACLWKGAVAVCNGAYVKGKSDNDYELLFPSLKSADRQLDANDPADRAIFPKIAHTRAVMEGDWYFLPPRGHRFDETRGAFTDLGPVPDFRSAEYREYVDQVTHWGYSPPSQLPPTGEGPPARIAPLIGLGSNWSGLDGTFIGTADNLLLLKKGAILFGEEPARSPFHHPLTPAQIVAYGLTKSVTTTPIVRGVLTDVSFFPFRREHFDFAVMSLEKPPPFGDDPIGDAGMGRGLLLLKWLLEGAFLPPFGGFNSGVTDPSMRAAVHARLVARADALAPEAFEWGLYQEFALLSESADLRVRPVDPEAAAARAACRTVFGDFLSAHDDKIMKKAGKAAIRGALGRLMMVPLARASVLATTPDAYAAAGFKSFEHFIEAKAIANLPLFSTYGPGGRPLTSTDFGHILGAKIGDKATFEAIRRSPDGVDGFLLMCFALLNQLQRDTASGYVTYLENLASQGAFAERIARYDNAAAVQHGFTPPGGETRSGRLAMHGIPDAGDHLAHWSFIINLRNNSGQSVGPLTVLLNDRPVCDNISLSPTDTSLVIPNKPRSLCASVPATEGLTYTRSVSQRGVQPLVIRINGIPPAINGNTDNDGMTLVSEFLDVDAFIGPDFRLPRIQVRGEVVHSSATQGIDGYEHAARFFLTDHAGQPIPGGTVRMSLVDPLDGPIDEERPDGRVPLTRGRNLVFDRIPEFTVYGIDAGGLQTSNRLVFTTDLSGFYREIHLRGATDGEAAMFEALRLPLSTPAARQDAALALYPHVSRAFAGVTRNLSADDLVFALGDRGVVFGDSSLAEVLIGKPLILQPSGPVNNRVYLPTAGEGHNPGRADATSSGLIIIHNELLDQALLGNLIQIRQPSGNLVTDGPNTRLSPSGWIRSEALHELDTRFIRAIYGTGVAGDTNQRLDLIVTTFDFPELLPFRTVND